MKSAILNFSILVCTTVVMLFVAEFVTRVTIGDRTVLFPRYHTDVKYGEFTIRRIRPNSVFRHTSIDGTWEFRTNSMGFRNDQEFSYDKPSGILRVLSLGDSHTQGYEVRQEYTFSAALERYLERQGYQPEVINTGVSGFGTAEQLILLENEGLKFRPDIVVLGFFANDFEDNLKTDLYRMDESGALLVNSREHVPGVRIQNFMYRIPGVKWLGENSYFYSVLFNTAWELAKARLTDASIEAATEFAVPQQTEYSDYDIALTSALIERMAIATRSIGAMFVVVDVPNRRNDGGFQSSVPEAMREFIEQVSDAYIDSEQLLGEYQYVAEIHVPHGHNHISEFSHTKIGAAVGTIIDRASGMSSNE
ncbi:MAG: hypothetical protein JJU27_19510 [Gammaproteobacteria bacterium]|nr:hypothetical protein [Gammaproteobacteria bacterium]